jgi:hypothetical protein
VWDSAQNDGSLGVKQLMAVLLYLLDQDFDKGAKKTGSVCTQHLIQ